jgi:2-polyprenyl-6-methoxyphenol hydroxylase-like FAD-dependent oxidoreductase
MNPESQRSRPSQPTVEHLETDCCIAGGGPAGMMLGYLLARAGVRVVVLEKHDDFLRDFRGDTIHPSTLDVLDELGLLEGLLARPHQKVRELHASIGGDDLAMVDFTHTPTKCQFVALVPQWDFLSFLADAASTYETFTLRKNAEVTGLMDANGRVTGVRAKMPEWPLEVTAHLVVGADGRGSAVREHADLEVDAFGAPIDVLWMRLAKHEDDPPRTLGSFDRGRLLVLLDRGDYWQCGFVIRKGESDELRARGLPAFKDEIATLAPFLRARTEELRSWDDVKLLTVGVDRLRTWWRPGLLCIGDAAHTMSPVGGVGINLAIQDAVAAANILTESLLRRTVDDAALAAVQKRRELPTKWTQDLQVFIQNRLFPGTVRSHEHAVLPRPLRLFNHVPFLRRIPARIVGVGIRPEHVGPQIDRKAS